MGNKFSADDLENWKPKKTMRRTQSLHRRKSQPTQEYNTIYDKIDKNSLHLTREPSKHARLNYMRALCDLLQLTEIDNHNNKINKNGNKIIKSLSLWNWRFLGSNDKYISMLADALKNNEYIDKLHLVNCHIDCENKIRILIEALKKRNIKLNDIDFSGNNFGNDSYAIKSLAIFLSTYQCTQNVKKITLRATKLQDFEFANFVQILSQSSTLLDSLELFSVTHNKLKSQSMDYLAQWLLSKQDKPLKIKNDKYLLIQHLSTFCPKNEEKKNKSFKLALTTNPIKDSGVKKLIPLMESDICISELHLRSCSITTRGIIHLLNAYLLRQERVIYQYTNLIYIILNEWIDIPSYLCSIIIQCIADWTLDERLKIHFGLSRCSLIVDDGFNNIISKYIINKKLIARCLDIRMKDTQNTDINIINIYKLFNYLKYSGNGKIGRLMFCVSSNKFNISNQFMQLLPTNTVEMDIDIVINNILYQQTISNQNNQKIKSLISDQQQLIIQYDIMNGINSLIDQRTKTRKKRKMEDILNDNINDNDHDDDDEDDNQAIVDMILLEKLRKCHILLKQHRSNIHDNGDIHFELNTNSDYGDFDITHTSYIDLYGDPIGFVF